MKALLAALPLLIACSADKNEGPLKEIANLGLDEVSGIEYIDGLNNIWAIQDSGNSNTIYGIDMEGKIAAKITTANNIDWESLAADNEGNLYVGDFGNNDNARRDLVIYKLNKSDLNQEAPEAVSKISFYFPEQKDFPPKKKDRLFDCEAFIEHNGSFYLFTKNRSSDFDGSLWVYKVPNAPGNHAAKRVGVLQSCTDGKTCAITGADISPDGKTIVLLSDDKVYAVTNFTNDSFANANVEVLELGHSSQKEGICFKGNETLLVADEKNKQGGGKLYQVKLSALKGKI